MPKPPSQTPRQPKLRASCDPCGAAKLKCDRWQPSCGRCLSLGLVCVYGVSRKKGKPPRVKLSPPDMRNISRKSCGDGEGDGSGNVEQHNNRSNPTYRDAPDGNSPVSAAGDGSVSGPPAPDCTPVLGFNHIPALVPAQSPDEGYASGYIPSFGIPDTLLADVLGPPIAGFGCLEFHDDLFPFDADANPQVSTIRPGWSGMDAFPTVGPGGKTASQSQPDGGPLSYGASVTPGHDCSREAFDILRTLSFLNSNPTTHRNTSPSSTPASAPTQAGPHPYPVPLDRILCLNREASERLGRLLRCHCSRRPYLALLYACIVSRVLNWYLQAVGHGDAPSLWDLPTAVAQDTRLRRMSTPGSCSGSVSAPSMSPFADATTSAPSAFPLSSGATALSVAPTEMALGAFNIDDQRVQTAMRIQLLLGEIRRAGDIIGLFTSRGGSGVGEFRSNGVDGLYNSLGSWLRQEQCMIAEIMRSRLKDLSA